MPDEAGAEVSLGSFGTERGIPVGLSQEQRTALRQQVEVALPPVGSEFIKERVAKWLEMETQTPNPKSSKELIREGTGGIKETEVMFPPTGFNKEAQAKLAALEFIERNLEGSAPTLGRIDFGGPGRLQSYLRSNFPALISEPIIRDLLRVEQRAKGSYAQRVEHERMIREAAHAGSGDRLSQEIQEGFAAARLAGEQFRQRKAEDFVRSLDVVSKLGSFRENLSSVRDFLRRLDNLGREIKTLRVGEPLFQEGAVYSVASGKRDERGIDINVLVTGTAFGRKHLEARKLKVDGAMIEMTVKDGGLEERFKVWGDSEALRKFCSESMLKEGRVELNLIEEKRLIEAFINDSSGKFSYDSGRLPEIISFLGRVLRAVEKDKISAKGAPAGVRQTVPAAQPA